MSDLIHFRAAIEYFNWPLGDKVTQGHIRTLNEAADALEAMQKDKVILMQRLARRDLRIAELESALELAMDQLTGEAWLAADLALQGDNDE